MHRGRSVVDRWRRFDAAPGFALVAAMNPFDAIGTARISSAIYDRMCRVTMGYQDADIETRIVEREASEADPDFVRRVVAVVRASRQHPDVRIVAAALDRELNPNFYIAPGLGDMGDRLFGTL